MSRHTKASTVRMHRKMKDRKKAKEDRAYKRKQARLRRAAAKNRAEKSTVR